MKILYKPEIINGEQAQGDTLNKYGVEFVKGQVTEVTDEELVRKMMTCPYFFNSDEIKEKPVVKKRRGRPPKNGNESKDS